MFISKMADPITLVGERLCLTSPEYPFETKDGLINEGPAVIKRNGRIFVTYSANDSRSDDYCLGLLTFTGGDILDINNWEKSKDAVFKKTDKIYGPGHNSFVSADGIDYIVYHANVVSGWGWGRRNVFIPPFSWDSKGYPFFGSPEF